MDKLSLFIHAHFLLVALFLVVFIAVIFVEARRQGAGTFRISAQALVGLMNHHQAIVVDLRESSAYKKGHIQSALSMPWADFDQYLGRLEKHKEKKLVFVCQGGQNSVRALTKLRKIGYKHLHVLNGGLGTWSNANMPFTQK